MNCILLLIFSTYSITIPISCSLCEIEKNKIFATTAMVSKAFCVKVKE